MRFYIIFYADGMKNLLSFRSDGHDIISIVGNLVDLMESGVLLDVESGAGVEFEGVVGCFEE